MQLRHCEQLMLRPCCSIHSFTVVVSLSHLLQLLMVRVTFNPLPVLPLDEIETLSLFVREKCCPFPYSNLQRTRRRRTDKLQACKKKPPCVRVDVARVALHHSSHSRDPKLVPDALLRKIFFPAPGSRKTGRYCSCLMGASSL